MSTAPRKYGQMPCHKGKKWLKFYPRKGILRPIENNFQIWHQLKQASTIVC